jgi:hypothetical protein
MCVYMHSRFVENHPIWILDDGPLISEVVLSRSHQQIIGNLNERLTWSSMSAHLSCFTNTLFVALFVSQHVGHAVSDSSWVNAMHEELENFEKLGLDLG